MLISRKSPFSGKVNNRELDITPEQVQAYLNGAMVQDAFPNLSPDDREFIISGITPEEWEQTFGKEE